MGQSSTAFPPPEEIHALRAAARTIQEVVPCRHSPEQLWPYFTQVDLYNRAGGSSAVEYEVVPNPGAASVVRGTSKKLGLRLRYRELPYEWQEPHFVHSEMLFDSGPFRYARIRGELIDAPPAARYRVDYVPRHRFGIAGLVAWGILKSFVKVFRRIDERLPETFADPLGVMGFEDRSEVARRRAAQLAERWRHLATDAVNTTGTAETVDTVVPESLAELVATAPDDLVGRMRPYGLAQQLGTSRAETLRFCCRAARAGFLDPSWDLICPSCGGAKRRSATLDELGDTAHCDVCNIRYGADLARNVELSFRPRPAVRELDDREYCLQSPSHQRQIVAQANVEPGATLRLALSLRPGHYRLRCIGREGEALFDSAYGRPRREVVVRVGARVEGVETDCGSAVELRLENDGPQWVTVRFEHHGYREDAACAAEVLALPEFRESFGDAAAALPAGIASESTRRASS